MENKKENVIRIRRKKRKADIPRRTIYDMKISKSNEYNDKVQEAEELIMNPLVFGWDNPIQYAVYKLRENGQTRAADNASIFVTKIEPKNYTLYSSNRHIIQLFIYSSIII